MGESGRMKEAEVEGEGEKGSVFHGPSNVPSVKTSRTYFTALRSTAPQHLCFMAVLADHTTTPLLLQSQTGSKRFVLSY